LGRAQSGLGNFGDAARSWESALPLPGAFLELIAFHRMKARDARRAGERVAAEHSYDKAVSLAFLWYDLYGNRRSGISGLEADEAVRKFQALVASGFSPYARRFSVDGPPPVHGFFTKTDLAFLDPRPPIPEP